jgi:TIR domain
VNQPKKHPVIFISYRRTDAGWPANLFANKLRTVFGSDQVFLDVRSIEAGEDFSEEIRSHLERAAVLIVLVGKSWLFVQDQFGRRRLDHQDDWVHREIRTALEHEFCKVIPVLLDDADLPNEQEALPLDIAKLLALQRIRVSHESSEDDIERLINEIEKSGFKRLPSAPNQLGSSSPVSREGVGIRLRRSPWEPSSSGSPRAEAASRLSSLIEMGKAFLNEPPSSYEELDRASRKWHEWRKYSEQSMREFFSSPETEGPLQWLREIKPRHLNFNLPRDVRTKELPRDIEREIAYFQNLLIRLDNYDEEAG